MPSELTLLILVQIDVSLCWGNDQTVALCLPFFSQCRLIAYHAVLDWALNGEHLGPGNRRILPSCIVAEIRWIRQASKMQRTSSGSVSLNHTVELYCQEPTCNRLKHRIVLRVQLFIFQQQICYDYYSIKQKQTCSFVFLFEWQKVQILPA